MPAPGHRLYVYSADTVEEPTTCPADGCSTAATDGVVFEPSGSDVALVFLNRPIRGYQGSTVSHFVPIYNYDEALMFGQDMFILGFGSGTCGVGATGIEPLRLGVARNSGGTTATSVDFIKNANDQIPLGGDSGSAAWPLLGGGWPRGAYGVLSNAIGCFTGRYMRPHVYRHWARTEIANHKPVVTYTFDTSLSGWSRDEPDSPTSASNWFVENGRLWDTTNVHGKVGPVAIYPDGAIVYPRGEIHEGVRVRVNVRSPDDDAAGIVFRYVDSTHYYLFTVRESTRTADIYKRKGLSFFLLGSATVPINWGTSGGVTLGLTARDFRFSGTVNGVTVSAVDSEYPVGRVGIFKWALSDSSFDDFNVTPLAPSSTASWPAP